MKRRTGTPEKPYLKVEPLECNPSSLVHSSLNDEGLTVVRKCLPPFRDSISNGS